MFLLIKGEFFTMSEKMSKRLQVPDHPVDVILDTDAYNEIDDQFAISYLIRSSEKLNIKAIYAAPFYNSKSSSPADGMEKSYDEIQKLLKIIGKKINVYKGSRNYLPDETGFVDSEAARDLVQRAREYTSENPLYVVAIGAITNIASALIIDPDIASNIVVIWLGGNSLDYCDTKEFNMWQDVAAARVVMRSKAPFVQLPCMGVVSEFRISGPELSKWLLGKGELADYLASNTFEEVASYCDSDIWTRVIWDVTAVAWLLNDNECFMCSRIANTRLPGYNGVYSEDEDEKEMCYVYYIKRDELMRDLIKKITNE